MRVLLVLLLPCASSLALATRDDLVLLDTAALLAD